MTDPFDQEMRKKLAIETSNVTLPEERKNAIRKAAARETGGCKGKFPLWKPAYHLPFASVALIWALIVIAGMHLFQTEPVVGPGPEGPRPVLPVVGSQENLLQLVSRVQMMPMRRNQSFPAAEFAEDGMVKSAAKAHSETNVQVRGVDEADIIKTDGTYLYQLREKDIIISRIHPAGRMAVVNRIPLEGMYPTEMYLDGSRLVVIGQVIDSAVLQGRMIRHSGSVVLHVYDLTDLQKVRQSRTAELEGNYLSSRKIGPHIYVVTNKWVYAEMLKEEPTVYYRDSLQGAGAVEVGLDRVRYFPDTSLNNYLTLAVLNLSENEPLTVETYLGSGQNLYMSHNALYLAVEGWGQTVNGDTEYSQHTDVHKFAVKGTKVEYAGKGQVPGMVLNQFSMDEYNGYFRIATTLHGEESLNNLYVLDEGMEIAGRLEGLAPRERIYSARFMGDKAYLVTFEMIDPLFVIDLKNPKEPTLLGELKIPGFSTYLHPLDDKTLFGIGRDTEVVTNHGRPAVREKGIKLAIFDVSDFHNPKELYVEIIGDTGTFSEALYNHKALMVMDDIFGFPVSVEKTGSSHAQAFQGGMVYRVSKAGGITKLGEATHIEGTPEYIYSWEAAGDFVKRLLYVDGVIYTISDNAILANTLNAGFTAAGRLSLR